MSRTKDLYWEEIIQMEDCPHEMIPDQAEYDAWCDEQEANGNFYIPQVKHEIEVPF